MKKILYISVILLVTFQKSNAAFLHNDYSYLQEITFELYTDEVPAYKVPEQIKSIEESLMFEILHATWKDKHWVAYTLNKNLLGTFKVGQPALLDNGDNKKLYFVAAFPGSVGGLDLYVSEYANGSWSKPKNLGKNINTSGNESNPGLLNDHTLTYSSGGIIKKLDLNTFKVVDLEESNVGDKMANDKPRDVLDNSPEQSKENKVDVVQTDVAPAPAENKKEVVKDNSTASSSPVVEEKVMKQNETPVYAETKVVKKDEAVKPTFTEQVANTSSSVEELGNKTREEMLSRYHTAIQLGAFSTPKWELFNPLSKFGKIITYKNDKNMNVVWITGFSNHAAAEAILPQVKSVMGFENAYITGK
ncbi:MAG: OmpA/MotB domain protein [Bacteroidota bacterium]|nr:OmpA/MotB domain protein [Bacteroidota bacterium]